MACEIAGFEVRDMMNWVYVQSLPKGQGQNHNIEKLDLPQDEKNKLKKKYSGLKTPQLKACSEPICVCMKPVEGTFLQNELNWGTGLIDFNQKVGIEDDHVPGTILSTDVFDETYDKHFLISKVSRKEKGDNNHPTIKPLELIEHLIKVFSKENALVLDPFLGSGTTAVACHNTGRKCFGIEINKEYFSSATKRIEKLRDYK
jgi:site-specific DNA-methyltransferase (adenine-specific)